MKKLVGFFIMIMGAVGSFVNAQTPELSVEEQFILKSRYEEMKVSVNYMAEDAFYGLTADYYVDSLKYGRLRTLCFRKELNKYVRNYSVPDPIERVRIKRLVEEQYWDSICRMLIPLNTQLTGKATGYALMMARTLELTEEEEQILMTNALDYAHRLRKNPCANFAREEMDKLKKTLKEEQLHRVINAKNSVASHLKANVLWQAIVKAHLDEGQDSVKQVRQAYLYYNLEQYVRDLYVEQPELLKANMNDLYNHKPDIIKMFEGIGKKEAIVKKREKEVGGEFAW